MESICCIDDNTRCREAVVTLLEEFGFKVASYQSAEKFLESRETFDRIILDHRLRGQTGLELLKTLRDHGDKTHVILYSGSVEIDNLSAAKSLPNVSVLSKPFKTQHLLRLLGVGMDGDHAA